MPALCFRRTARQGEPSQPAPFRKPPPAKHLLRTANGALALPAPLPAPLPPRAKQTRPAAAEPPRPRSPLRTGPAPGSARRTHPRRAAERPAARDVPPHAPPAPTNRRAASSPRSGEVCYQPARIVHFSLPASLYFYNLPLAGSSQQRQKAAGPGEVEAAGAASPTAAGWGKPAPAESGSLNSSGL